VQTSPLDAGPEIYRRIDAGMIRGKAVLVP